jgi:subfamily B ATP-binding cassette protein MsbA
LKKENDVSQWSTLARTIRFAAKNKKLFALTIFFTLFVTALSLLIPYLYSQFFNYAQKAVTTGSGVDSQFALLAIAYFSVSIVETISNSLKWYINTKWWLKTQLDVFLSSFEHVSTLSLNFFEVNPTGKIRERVWNGSQAITNILDELFTSILPQVLFILSSIVILYFINPIFSISLIILVPIYFFIMYKFNKKLRPLRAEGRVRWEALSTHVTDSIYNIRTVKTNAKEDFHYNTSKELAGKALDKELDWQRVNAWSQLSYGSVIDVTRMLVLLYSFYLVIIGNIQIGTAILIWSYINSSLQPISGMVRDITAVQKNLVDTQLTFVYLDTLPEIIDSPTATNKHFKHPAIALEKVKFSYKDEETIKNLSLEVPGGNTVAIVGKSGSGKSTLIKLLLRLYDTNGGKISIDNVDIKDLHQRSLRENISVVMQDSVIFNDTALNNIRYARQSASKRDVEKAAKLAGADKFLEALPDKYNTILGEKGVKLSGGEQQRINIARAFLKNAPILILDEATSSLDSEIEQEIQESMWELAKNRTTIIIAHRLSTVMKADLIVVMDKGRISEMGAHEDLVKGKGIYSRLFEIQSGGYLK